LSHPAKANVYVGIIAKKKQMTHLLSYPKNERQLSIKDFCHCIMKYPVGCAVTVSHNATIGCLSIEQWWWQHYYYVLKMSVNRASTTFGLASCNMHGLCSDVAP
jgi:hypothetical protein